MFVNYVGVRSEDGTEFDNNYGGDPFPVTLGTGGVIAGWDQGLVGRTPAAAAARHPQRLAYGDSRGATSSRPATRCRSSSTCVAVVPPTDPADAPTDIPTSDELVDRADVEDLTTARAPTLEPARPGCSTSSSPAATTAPCCRPPGRRSAAAGPRARGRRRRRRRRALTGMQVGGRRAITVPPNPDSGLTPETNLVIVADLIADVLSAAMVAHASTPTVTRRLRAHSLSEGTALGPTSSSGCTGSTSTLA